MVPSAPGCVRGNAARILACVASFDLSLAVPNQPTSITACHLPFFQCIANAFCSNVNDFDPCIA